jgi:hypothetical protein
MYETKLIPLHHTPGFWNFCLPKERHPRAGGHRFGSQSVYLMQILCGTYFTSSLLDDQFKQNKIIFRNRVLGVKKHEYVYYNIEKLFQRYTIK